MATPLIDAGTRSTGTDVMATPTRRCDLAGTADPGLFAVTIAVTVTTTMRTRSQTRELAPISAPPEATGPPFAIARPSLKRARPASPDAPAHEPHASKDSKMAKETRGETIKRLLPSELPAYAFNTPPKLYVKVRDRKTGGNQWVLAKTSQDTERHETEAQTPLSPCTDAEAMLIRHDIHPLLSGHDVDLGQAM